MNEQAAVDRIMETENLTDALEDNDARWLMEWGIKCLHNLIETAQDDQEANIKVNALMAVMRKINQIAAGSRDKSPQELAEELTSLGELAAKVFVAVRTGKEPAVIAGELAGLSAGDALKTLTGWVTGAED